MSVDTCLHFCKLALREEAATFGSYLIHKVSSGGDGPHVSLVFLHRLFLMVHPQKKICLYSED